MCTHAGFGPGGLYVDSLGPPLVYDVCNIGAALYLSNTAGICRSVEDHMGGKCAQAYVPGAYASLLGSVYDVPAM